MSSVRPTSLLSREESGRRPTVGRTRRVATLPVSARRPSPVPSAVGLVISAPITRSDIRGLCERVRQLLEACNAEVVVCDVGALVEPDATAIDALARLQLIARRSGRQICLRHAGDELRELLGVTGLCDIVPLWAGLGLQSRGQAEQWKEGRGVEEEADPGDPAP